MKKIQRIIISRTDNLGDVMLTLPMAGVLVKHFPDAKIYFLGKAYTKSLVECCRFIDGFIDRTEVLEGVVKLSDYKADAIIHVFPDKEIAKTAFQAKIPVRIGTSHRWFHWLYGNKLINLGRKDSPLHEAQMNLKLLKYFGIKKTLPLDEIKNYYGFHAPNETKKSIKKTIIIHPKSKGSAREWALENYFALIQSLSKEHYRVIVTGTKAEGEKILSEMPNFFNETGAEDFTGQLNLTELIQLIAESHILVACSTGPLHIAAALGTKAIGIYPPMRPIHPGRWAPLGTNTKVFYKNIDCNACEKTQLCSCINSINFEQIKTEIMKS